jgi:uncharacterized protein
MGERERYTPGTFCWADLGTANQEAAARFYGGLFGWEPETRSNPTGGVYTLMRLDGKAVAGLRDGPAAWLSYVSVEDVDASVARVRELGGIVVDGPVAIGAAGRLALVQDPQGAMFALWQPGDHVGAALVNEVGAMVWQHLSTPDVAAARDWYARLFEWTWEELEGGGGWWNARNRDGWLTGSVSGLPAEGVPPNWQVSFRVEDAAAACARAEELGGATTLPRTETPVGGIAVVRDPEGAPFGFFDGVNEP